MATYRESDKQLSRLNLTSQVAISGGSRGGMFAGVIMISLAMLGYSIQGAGFFTPLRFIAVTFLGEEAAVGGVFSIFIGLITHLVISSIWGMIFALITSKIQTRGALLATGVLFGIFVWMVMTYFILTVFNQPMQESVLTNPSRWFINHLVFGLALSYFSPRSIR